MSHRANNAKKINRLRKTIARRPLPAYIDLVQYLQDRGHAQTAGQAKRMLLDGKVRVGANAVGRRADPTAKPVPVSQHPQRLLAHRQHPDIVKGFVLDPLVKSSLRGEITVRA
jgi:hypothetical protein